MKIDWFTFFAQVVNFLILVGLLRHFLYGRITAAMEAREKKIGDRVAEADRRREEADRAAEEYRRKTAELEERRAALMARAGAEAEQHRRELSAKAQKEIDEARARWQAALAGERESLLGQFREKAAAEVLHAARRTLADLAGESLERRIAGVLMERMGAGDEQRLRELHTSRRRVVVKSAFVIPLDAQKQMIDELRRYVNVEGGVQFETAQELVCGIELRINGSRISWNIDHYLKDLEEQVMRSIEQREQLPAKKAGSGKVHAHA